MTNTSQPKQEPGGCPMCGGKGYVTMDGNDNRECPICVGGTKPSAAPTPPAPVMPVEPVVKPLEWNPFRAETAFGYYYIDDQRDRTAEELKGRPPFLLSGSRVNLARYDTLEAAKAAAQADYEARIRSALSTPPAPAVADEPVVVDSQSEKDKRDWQRAYSVLEAQHREQQQRANRLQSQLDALTSPPSGDIAVIYSAKTAKGGDINLILGPKGHLLSYNGRLVWEEWEERKP